MPVNETAAGILLGREELDATRPAQPLERCSVRGTTTVSDALALDSATVVLFGLTKMTRTEYFLMMSAITVVLFVGIVGAFR